MWKSSYLSKDDSKLTALAVALPHGETTLLMVNNLVRLDFSALKLLLFNHDIYDNLEEEKKIIANEKVMNNACLIHYDII